MEHPYFLEPGEHRLGTHYRRLNQTAFIGAPAVFFLNEFFMREKILASSPAPDSILATVARILNADFSGSPGLWILVTLMSIVILLGITFSLLPRWGRTASRHAMKKGLPDHASYARAFFLIEKPVQRAAFFFWHFFLMRISWLLGVVTPYILINLLRGLP